MVLSVQQQELEQQEELQRQEEQHLCDCLADASTRT